MSSDPGALLGGIEFGGTKTVVAVGQQDGEILAREAFPTELPTKLVPKIAQYFEQQPHGPIQALGCGAFGPIVIDPLSPDYGKLLGTNKPGWSGFDLAGALSSACHVPVTLVTDVAAAGIGEAQFGALRDIALGIYLTLGTGIGGAVLLRGEPLPALLHPEMGHIALQRLVGDSAPSTCQFHQNCAEGLAAGPAISARFGRPLSDFDGDGPEMELVSDYIGQLCAAIFLMLSPQRIVIGGGVADTPGLLERSEASMLRHLGGYAVAEMPSQILYRPQLGANAGIIGAISAANGLMG